MSQDAVSHEAPTHREMIDHLIRMYGSEANAAKALKMMLKVFGGDHGRTVLSQQTLSKWKLANHIPANKAMTFCAAAQWHYMPWQVSERLYPRRLLQRLCSAPANSQQMIAIAEGMLLIEAQNNKASSVVAN